MRSRSLYGLSMSTERYDVVVIGAGQAGLATGHYLAGRGLRFTILEGHTRIGESWRRRWDTLRVFTPARNDALPGMPFPAAPHAYPTKDEVADYLESYARRMDLPVRTGVRVERLDRIGGDVDRGPFLVSTDAGAYEAGQVVVASGAFQEPNVPEFAAQLDPGITQLHSSEYRSPAQLQPGPVLVVGASNSGAEIAVGAAADHETWLSGRDTGNMPFDLEGGLVRWVDLVFWPFIHYVATIRTPIGRRVRVQVQRHGGALERTRSGDLAAAGVRRVVGRTVGVREGLPVLDDGTVLDVRTVVWATGFRHDYPWICLPVIGADGWPVHERGVVPSAPGLYFVGLPFQYAATSALIGGVGRDARYVVEHIVASQPA
jgi:putative flavoprotein involved in K+ transport